MLAIRKQNKNLTNCHAMSAPPRGSQTRQASISVIVAGDSNPLLLPVKISPRSVGLMSFIVTKRCVY